MKRKHCRSGWCARVLVEGLEARVMMSAADSGTVDLVPSYSALPKLSNTLVTGTSIKGTMKITVSNAGTGADKTAAGVGAYLRPAGGDGSTDVLIMTKLATVPALAAGKGKPVTLNLVVPTTLTAGEYEVVIKTDVNGAVAETDESNNELTIPFLLNAATGFEALSGSLSVAGLPATIAAGASNKGSLKLNLTNAGNLATPAGGTVTVVLSLRPAGGGADVPLATLDGVKLPTLKVGKSGKVTIPATWPGTVPAGSYTLVATVTGASFSTDPVELVGPTVTVTGSGPNTGPLLKHGDTVSFSASSTTSTTEDGGFATSTGEHGTYHMTNGSLTLTYDSGDVDVMGFTFFSGSFVSFGLGTTVTFSTQDVNSFAVVTINGELGYARYEA